MTSRHFRCFRGRIKVNLGEVDWEEWSLRWRGQALDSSAERKRRFSEHKRLQVLLLVSRHALDRRSDERARAFRASLASIQGGRQQCREELNDLHINVKCERTRSNGIDEYLRSK